MGGDNGICCVVLCSRVDLCEDIVVRVEVAFGSRLGRLFSSRAAGSNFNNLDQYTAYLLSSKETAALLTARREDQTLGIWGTIQHIQ